MKHHLEQKRQKTGFYGAFFTVVLLKAKHARILTYPHKRKHPDKLANP